MFIGLQLFISGFNRCVFIGGIFKLNHHQGQAINKQHHIGAFIHAVLNHGQLIGHHKIIVFWVSKIHQPHQITALASVFLIGYLHPLRQQSVKALVIGEQFRGMDARNFFNGFLLRFIRNAGVNSGNRIRQTRR